MDATKHFLQPQYYGLKCIKYIITVTNAWMDVFLAPLSLIFSYNATTLRPQIMNRLALKSIHSGIHFCY